MSQQDFEKWETRYRSGSDLELGEPETFVIEATDGMEVGRAIDIAGGTGRHALWLVLQGWAVTLADISPSALRRAAERAERSGRMLSTVAVDLEDPVRLESLLPARTYDLVVCTWFMPSTPLWAKMAASLSSVGRLIYVMPTERNLGRHPKPSRRYLLEDGCLPQKLHAVGLSTVTYEEGWDQRGYHTARALAKRLDPSARPATLPAEPDQDA